ncbi:hypothetical protein [Planotetraspora kaengkrachanensis]|uniref:hypothetical protein n=1 Tax=Planotetraspora kaengkrachanensis TaxID=575193 RepID=UPI0019423B51|nr:hypothetical protein [Planotetraspora kaengkrachanensis]
MPKRNNFVLLSMISAVLTGGVVALGGAVTTTSADAAIEGTSDRSVVRHDDRHASSTPGHGRNKNHNANTDRQRQHDRQHEHQRQHLMRDFATTVTPLQKSDTQADASQNSSGPKGEQGPPGRPGVSGYEEVLGPPVTCAPNTLCDIAIATCSAGKQPVGGGYTYDPFGPTVPTILDTNRPGDNTWRVGLSNLSTTTITIFPRVRCAYIS